MHDSGESVDDRLKSWNKFSVFIFDPVYLIKGNSIFECPSCTATKNLNTKFARFSSFNAWPLTRENTPMERVNTLKVGRHTNIVQSSLIFIVNLKTKR